MDKENSTFECIKFKKDTVSFDTIFRHYENFPEYSRKISSTSFAHMLKIGAINKLLYVAKYLNDEWVPDFTSGKSKYYLSIGSDNTLQINASYYSNTNSVYFKSEELAQQAIDILGEDTIRKALITNY